jgi:hypothetical protein
VPTGPAARKAQPEATEHQKKDDVKEKPDLKDPHK